MELNPTARFRRNEPLNRPAAKAKTTGTASGRAQSAADRLTLSQQAVAYLREQNRRTQEALAQQRAKRAKEAAEGTDGEGDQLTKAMKKMKKCQQIAARIMAGDKVPPEDERYLMENDPDSYKLAMAARTPKKKPKEWDSVLDKDDRQGEQTEAASEDGGASDGAPEASGGESAGEV